ncbi:factor VIII intron 22 protein-like [Myzus persicae]|uniref:factor VIII intron 22 protein-like n=1 Tax=Myzus persicae TaxID=13164 RepID=UPI000B934CA9|nr:factor VIII intron 22 protein-like [Myzus persicae]XP_022183379.1 factor VIII intron 22 protein-like [Myzus persicae]
MASFNNPEEIIYHYKIILNKTKKKLFRKINTLEPSDQFAKLANFCQKNDKHDYAALCWQAVAKCEDSMGHSCEQALAHQKAARQFFSEHKKTESSGLISPYNENLQAGLSEMRHAEDSWQGNSFENILKTSIRLETAETLVSLGKLDDAAFIGSSMIDVPHESHTLKLAILEQITSVQILSEDYEGALLTFTEIANTISCIDNETIGIYNDILFRCEISRVFLLLILKPTRQKMPSDLASVLEKYMWINGNFDSPVPYISDIMFRLLRSLVKAYQLGETTCLGTIESDFTPHLTSEQRHLLAVLINTLT